jgi:hypothetical protein
VTSGLTAAGRAKPKDLSRSGPVRTNRVYLGASMEIVLRSSILSGSAALPAGYFDTLST